MRREGGVTWDYEEGPDYYHFYACSGPLDGRMDALALEVRQCPENDADAQIICDALNRMALREVSDE